MAVSQPESDHFRRAHRRVQDASEECDETPPSVAVNGADIRDSHEELPPLRLVDQDPTVYILAPRRGGTLNPAGGFASRYPS